MAVRDITAWFKEKAIPLNSVEPHSGFDDLQPLKEVLKGVRILGLGEATHGTREFFRFKHRMVEFLVEEMGFRVFTIEAGYPSCLNINDYVLYGKGDPAAALAGQGYWCWDTEEVLEMINWMRKYNLACRRGKECKFLGYDIKPVKQAIDVVERYVAKVAPEYLEQVRTAISALYKLKLHEDISEPPELMASHLEKLYGIIGFLSARRTGLCAKTSRTEFEHVLQHARILTQLYDTFGVSKSGLSRRDLYMAENFEYLVENEDPGTRFIVWAHNAHVATDSSWKSMGYLLRERFGPEYYALGFAFNQGGFQSREMTKDNPLPGELQDYSLPPAAEGSVEWHLSKAGYDSFIVDFRSLPESGVAREWLATEQPMRSIGAGFSYTWPDDIYVQKVSLANCYDGLFYTDKTTPARPTRTGVRKAGVSGALI